jgi:hypothetical protein
MASATGTQFADFRNGTFGIGPEPNQPWDTPILDTLGEKSLTMPYSYGYGSPYGSSTVNLPSVGSGATPQDLDGVLPSGGTYENNGPSDGFY